MSFLVEGFLDDHSLSATIATAREAFAKAIEWRDTGRFRTVTINDDSNGQRRWRCYGRGSGT